MGSDKEKPSITAYVEDALNLSKSRYKELGLEIDEVLDSWAREYAEDLKNLKIEYPKDDSTDKKCEALARVFIKNRIEGGKLEIEAHIARMQSGGLLAPVDCRQVSELDAQLEGEAEQNPELKSMIEEVREKIQELRELFKASRGRMLE